MKIKNPLKIFVSDTITPSDSLRIDKFNAQKEHVGTSVVNDTFEASSSNENGNFQEKLTVKQRVKRAKQQQEIEAVQRFLPVYNSHNNTDYENPVGMDERSDVDVVCTSASGAYTSLDIQITVSEREAFGKLGSQKGFDRSFTGSAPWFALWKDVILAKSNKYSPSEKKNLILLLDAWPVAYKRYLEEFRDTKKTFLKQTGFKEIWFAGTTPDLVVKLY